MGAGDWIKMRNNLWDDPRVAQMCVLMSQPEAVIVGCLYRLWALADEHTETGTLPTLTAAALDRKVGFGGFAAALTAVGWLAESDAGLVINRFDEHNGLTAKRRASDAKRKALDRSDDACPQAVRSDADTRRTDGGPRNRNRIRLDPDSSPVQSGARERPLRGRRGQSVFEGIEPEVLEDTERLREWFEDQSQTRRRVLPLSESAWLVCLAAAEQALAGDNPAAWFASIIGKRKHEQITEAAKSRAMARAAEHRKKLNAPKAQP